MNETETQSAPQKKNSKTAKIMLMLAIVIAILLGIWYLHNRTVNIPDNNTEALIPDINASDKTTITWQGDTPQQTELPMVNTAQDHNAPNSLDMASYADIEENNTQAVIPNIDSANKNNPAWAGSSSQQTNMPSINTAEDQTPPQKLANTGRQKESILFYFDSTELKEGQMIKIEEFVKKIPHDYQGEILIEGYTCDIGEDAYNEDLSLKRATAIANLFHEKGYQNTKVVSYGESAYSTQKHPIRYLYRKVDISLN